MGERALAVVPDERGAVTYASQWGGSDAFVARVLDAGPDEQFTTLLNGEWRPRATRSLVELARRLDYLAFEVVYVLSANGVGVYEPVWLGLHHPSADPTDGALVRVESHRERQTLRSFVRFTETVLGDAVRADVCQIADARRLFVRALSEYCPAERLAVVAVSRP